MNSEELVQLVMERILKELSKETQDKYLWFGEASAVTGDFQITLDTNDYASVKGLIFNGFGWGNLFRLRNLVSISDNEQWVVKALIENKSIIIIQPEALPCNQSITIKAEETLRELKKMGVVFVREIELSQYLQSLNHKVLTKDENITTGSSKKKLITVDVLRKEYSLDQLTEFKQEPNMIITALAKDYLRENNIRMI